MKVISHHDTDGIISGLMTCWGLKLDPIENLYIWDGNFGDTCYIENGDYMVDMKPINNIKGFINIDHHLEHPNRPLYKLIYPPPGEDWCTVKLAWEKFKRILPKDKEWLIAAGFFGDSKQKLIPPEIRKKYKTYFERNINNSHGNCHSIFEELSYSINKIPRFRAYLNGNGYNGIFNNKYRDLIEILVNSDTPEDIIYNSKIVEARTILGKDVYEEIPKNCICFNFGKLYCNIYESLYRVSGWLAIRMVNDYKIWNNKINEVMVFNLNSPLKDLIQPNSTTIAIEKNTGRGSGRGNDLEYFVKYYLNKIKGVNIGGHPDCKGLTLNGITTDYFLEELTKLFKEEKI